MAPAPAAEMSGVLILRSVAVHSVGAHQDSRQLVLAAFQLQLVLAAFQLHSLLLKQ